MTVLMLPGWQGSGPGHWQTRWEALYGYQRVEQADWLGPLRGDWSARLEDVIADMPDRVVLVAHSLGCVLTAWWARHSRFTDKVQGALLVAPPDLDRDELPAPLCAWRPLLRTPLPFPACVLASRNDPYATLAFAQALAHDWGATCVDVGELGHINADSGLGDWAAGHAHLERLLQQV